MFDCDFTCGFDLDLCGLIAVESPEKLPYCTCRKELHGPIPFREPNQQLEEQNPIKND